jgi:hypothetical protein
MKTMGSSYSSVKTAGESFVFSSLPLDKGEAFFRKEELKALSQFLKDWRGCFNDIEVVLPSGESFVLSMRGRVHKNDLEEEKALFQGKVNTLVDTLWEKSVISLLHKKWAGSMAVLSYGYLRHQMSQMARGYNAQASKKRAEEKAAYRLLSKKLDDKEEVRLMLSRLSGNTISRGYEMLRGQHGRIRIVILS